MAGNFHWFTAEETYNVQVKLVLAWDTVLRLLRGYLGSPRNIIFPNKKLPSSLNKQRLLKFSQSNGHQNAWKIQFHVIMWKNDAKTWKPFNRSIRNDGVILTPPNKTWIWRIYRKTDVIHLVWPKCGLNILDKFKPKHSTNRNSGVIYV